MVTRTSIEDNSAANPGSSSYSTSGDNDGSGISQDWYNHTQTVDAKFTRINNYDYAVSSPYGNPTVVGNQLRIEYAVQTVDEIIYSANFLGDQVALQTLELASNASSGQFGTQGTINTSSIGLIRRAARKDVYGNIVDSSGLCIKSGTLYLDDTPGAYDGTFDVSTGVNGILHQFIQNLHRVCRSFSPTLVDL